MGELIALDDSDRSSACPVSASPEMSLHEPITKTTGRDSFEGLMSFARKKWTSQPSPSPSPHEFHSEFKGSQTKGSFHFSPAAKSFTSLKNDDSSLHKNQKPVTPEAVPSHDSQDERLQHLQGLIEAINSYPIDKTTEQELLSFSPTAAPCAPPSEELPIRIYPISSFAPPDPPSSSVEKVVHEARTADLLGQQTSNNISIAHYGHGPTHRPAHTGSSNIGDQRNGCRYRNETDREGGGCGTSVAQQDGDSPAPQVAIGILNVDTHTIGDKERLEEQNDNLKAENSYLRATMTANDKAHEEVVNKLVLEKSQAIEILENTNIDLEKLIQSMKMNDQANNEDHAKKVQTLTDEIRKIEETNADLKVKLQNAMFRARMLTAKCDDLQLKSSTKLQQKESEIAILKKDLAAAHRRFEDSQSKVNRASDNGKALRGAAHQVQPHSGSEMPRNVYACIACYKKNLACDNLAHCWNCVEANEKCLRWRCSMKHVLGECHDVPCKWIHDNNGWIMSMESRPEW